MEGFWGGRGGRGGERYEAEFVYGGWGWGGKGGGGFLFGC